MLFIAEAFFGGCISKVINDGKDYTWIKIKKVIDDKNNRNMYTKIYRVIENTLNIVTDKKFKGTEVLYKAMERIFIEFKDNGSTIESVKSGLVLLDSNAGIERCEYFLEKFYHEICEDKNLKDTLNLMLQVKISQQVESLQNTARSYEERSNFEHNIENAMGLYDKSGALVTYSNNFQNTLFLHKNAEDNVVTLKDIYITIICRIL